MKVSKFGLLVALGFMAGAAAFTMGKGIEVAAADETSTDTVTIDLNIKGDSVASLLEEGDELHLYYWGSGITEGPAWPGVSAEGSIDTSDASCWKVTLPAGASYFLINDGGQGNQTQDIRLFDDFLGGRRLVDGVTPTYWLDGTVDWEGTDKGKIRAYLDLKREYSYSPDYFRYWLDRNGQEAGTSFLVYGLGTDEETMVPASGYAAIGDPGSSEYWAYFDVPVEAIGTEYSIRFSGDDRMNEPAANCCETNQLTMTSDTIHKIHRISWGAEAPWPIQVSEGTLSEYEISASFFGNYVLTSYFTCLPSEVNGYLAASELRANWITPDDTTWYIHNELSTVTIDDYAVASSGVEDYYDYYLTAQKVPGTNAQEKMDLMLSLETLHGTSSDASVTAFFSEPGNVAGVAAGALVLLSLAGFSLFFLLRRKKHSA